MQKSCNHQIKTCYHLIPVGQLISAKIYRIQYEKKYTERVYFFQQLQFRWFCSLLKFEFHNNDNANKLIILTTDNHNIQKRPGMILARRYQKIAVELKLRSSTIVFMQLIKKRQMQPKVWSRKIKLEVLGRIP